MGVGCKGPLTTTVSPASISMNISRVFCAACEVFGRPARPFSIRIGAHEAASLRGHREEGQPGRGEKKWQA